MALFDAVRGFSVVSMVLFHLCYDLRYLFGHDLSFFQPPFQDIWRASISWTFLLVAGFMCSFSRNGLYRALRYLAAALAIYLVTLVAAVDTPISFGIIYCMGASTLIEHLLCRAGLAPKGWNCALLLFVAFLALYGLPRGYLGIAGLRLPLPSSLYQLRYLSWLGIPAPTFASGDYYPILPFTLLFLCGSAMGRTLKQTGYPAWCHKVSCKPLEFIGRHALPIYLLHQPIILGLASLL